jgi:hypothetical protein
VIPSSTGRFDRRRSHFKAAIESGTSAQLSANTSLKKPVTIGPLPAIGAAKSIEFDK